MASTRVTIGMPVYNGTATVSQAVESLLVQSLKDFELVISDNASTDGTFTVLQDYARRDSRIRLIQQSRNIGAHANFGFVLSEAASPFFMWAACDDRWATSFIDRNVDFLEQHPDFIGSISRVAFEGAPLGFNTQAGTYPLEDSVATNLRRYIMNPQANSRYYGVHRTDALLRAWITEPFWAGDWAVVLRLLVQGKYHEIPETLMWRSYHGASSDAFRAIRAWDLGWIGTCMPMLPFACSALEIREVRNDPRLWMRLAFLNIRNTAYIGYRALRSAFERTGRP